MKKIELVEIRKLTAAGKDVASWEFEEDIDMDTVRAVINLTTGEIVFAVKMSAEDASHFLKINPRTVYTKKGVWCLWSDGWNYAIHRIGDRED